MVSQNRVSLLTMLHGSALFVTRQRQDGRTLSAGQQGDHFFQTLGRRVHHDVFGFARLESPPEYGSAGGRLAAVWRQPFRHRAESGRL